MGKKKKKKVWLTLAEDTPPEFWYKTKPGSILRVMSTGEAVVVIKIDRPRIKVRYG